MTRKYTLDRVIGGQLSLHKGTAHLADAGLWTGVPVVGDDRGVRISTMNSTRFLAPQPPQPPQLP